MIHKSRVSGLHEDAQKLYNELVQWYNSCKEEDQKAKELGYTGGLFARRRFEKEEGG